MARTRSVDGAIVSLSAEEERAFADEQAALTQELVDRDVADAREKKIRDRMTLNARTKAIADLKRDGEI